VNEPKQTSSQARVHAHPSLSLSLSLWTDAQCTRMYLVRFEVHSNSTASNLPCYVRSGVSRSEVYRTYSTGLDSLCTEDWR